MAMATGTALAIGAAISVVGGVIGNEAAKGGRDAAARSAQAAWETINALQIPDIEKQKLMLEVPKVMGQYFPEQEVAQALEQTNMVGITTDPRLADAQMRQLETLTSVGESGFTPEMEAELNKLRRDTAGQEQSRQSGIIQNMAQRGVGGSGIELASRLSSSQGAAQRQAEEADRQAAMAFRNMLEAQSQAGNLATNMRGQEFGEKSQVAKAMDEINRFNTTNKQAVQQRNISGRNEAQRFNLAEQQRIADQGVQLRNQQQQYNKNLLQQQYDNEAKKASMLAGQHQNIGAQQQAGADAVANQWKQIGSGAGGLVSAYGGGAPVMKPAVQPQAAPQTISAMDWDEYQKRQGLA